MQKELLEYIRKNRREYQKTILESIGFEVYECERYNINISISLAIVDTQSSVYLEEFTKTLRGTDKFITLDDHIYCVLFPFTDTAQGVKAVSNLLNEFEMRNFSEKIYLGVVNLEDCQIPEREIGRLFDILEYAIENGMNNIPLNTTNF